MIGTRDCSLARILPSSISLRRIEYYHLESVDPAQEGSPQVPRHILGKNDISFLAVPWLVDDGLWLNTTLVSQVPETCKLRTGFLESDHFQLFRLQDAHPENTHSL